MNSNSSNCLSKPVSGSNEEIEIEFVESSSEKSSDRTVREESFIKERVLTLSHHTKESKNVGYKVATMELNLHEFSSVKTGNASNIRASRRRVLNSNIFCPETIPTVNVSGNSSSHYFNQH